MKSRLKRAPSVCARVSGGLDSCVMLAELARAFDTVHPVYVREGLAWEDAELGSLRRYRRQRDHACDHAAARLQFAMRLAEAAEVVQQFHRGIRRERRRNVP